MRRTTAKRSRPAGVRSALSSIYKRMAASASKGMRRLRDRANRSGENSAIELDYIEREARDILGAVERMRAHVPDVPPMTNEPALLDGFVGPIQEGINLPEHAFDHAYEGPFDGSLNQTRGRRNRSGGVFPVGALVLVDGRDKAKVVQAFPHGSSSFLFPHYKVNFVRGDRNVAVPMARVGVVSAGNRAGGRKLAPAVVVDRAIKLLQGPGVRAWAESKRAQIVNLERAEQAKGKGGDAHVLASSLLSYWMG